MANVNTFQLIVCGNLQAVVSLGEAVAPTSLSGGDLHAAIQAHRLRLMAEGVDMRTVMLGGDDQPGGSAARLAWFWFVA
jgi:hypothetical protein